MKLKCLLVFVFSVNCIYSSVIVAEKVQTKTKELTGLQKKIKQISRKINDLKTKKDSLLAELKKVDIEYGESVVFLQKVELQISKLNMKLEKNRRQIASKQGEIDAQKDDLKSQIKAAHGMGRNEKLKLMLNQQDPSLSGRIMVYFDYLNKVRLKKIEKINVDLNTLQELEAKRITESGLLKEELHKRTIQRSILLKTKKDRQLLLAKINKQYSSKKQQLNQFKSSEKRLKLLISSLQQTMDDFPFEEGAVKEFVKLKGKLPWPLKGKIIKNFATHRSDSQWDGVLIKAREGTNIRAVTRGRVVYADWLRGYGLLTIIDHGKGYMTLYAFNQSLYKSVGDWVETGNVIATVGQSGGQSDSGLYFGIRKKGKPVNPVTWCRKIRHQ